MSLLSLAKSTPQILHQELFYVHLTAQSPTFARSIAYPFKFIDPRHSRHGADLTPSVDHCPTNGLSDLPHQHRNFSRPVDLDSKLWG
jgi:hypothetical protein